MSNPQATYHNNPGMGVAVTSSTIAAYLLVTAAAGPALAGVGTTRDWIGWTMEPRSSSTGIVGATVPVRFPQAGTAIGTGDGSTITAGTIVYKAANGRLGTTASGSIAVGIALTPASAAGDWFELLPY